MTQRYTLSFGVIIGILVAGMYFLRLPARAENVGVDATIVSICGNGAIEGAESCDGDALGGATCETVGDFTGGDLACTAACAFNTSRCTNDGGGAAIAPPPPPPPPVPICGNGLVEIGEACDDGNGVHGDGCFACAIEVIVCGNGVVEFGEGCDDGNRQGGDGCSAICQVEMPICGNNIIEQGEACDDGNVVQGDGCNNLCQIEHAHCGNNILEGAEQCDDGNLNNNDGCDNQCQVEVPDPICGNGQVEQGEQCDDGNLNNKDGCDNQCQVEIPLAVCGNGQVEQGEQCDDGNLNNNDGCSAFCAVEANPQDPNQPVVQLPVQGGGGADGGNGNIGGGAGALEPEEEKIALNTILFWIAQRSIQVFPDDAAQVKSLVGDAVSVALPSVVIPKQNVRQVVLQAAGMQYPMTFQEGDGRYYADVPLSQVGVFESRILVSYADGTTDTVPFRLLSLSPGKISGKDGSVLAGAEVRLQYANGESVLMAPYGQVNPIVVGNNATYGFVVPNGSYKLVVTYDGYRTKETFSFRVEEHVINQHVELIKKTITLDEALSELDPDAGNGEKIAVITKVVSKKVVEQVHVATEAAIDVVKKVKDVADDPEVEAAVKEVVAPASIGVSAAVVVPSLWSTMVPLLRYIFLQPLLLLGKRKRREWGTVYNSLTKLPIDLAVVRLVDAKTKRIKQSRVTDMHGRYVFMAEPGEYVIEVTKPGFHFPTAVLQTVTADGDFIDLYHGEPLAVQDSGSNLTPNIPIDPPGETKTPKRVVWEKRLRGLQHAISLTGIAFAAVSFYVSPSWLVGSFLVVHVVMYIGFNRFVKPKQPKGWGIVYDEKTKKPLAGAAVRLFTKEYNKLVSTQVTDKKGRYAFLVGPNTYYVTSEKTGYDQFKSDDIAIEKKDSQSFLKQDVAMDKGGADESPPSTQSEKTADT